MRQLIWGLITVLMIYGGWQFLRALRTDRRRQQSDPLAGTVGQELNLDDVLFNYAPTPASSSTRKPVAPLGSAFNNSFGSLDTPFPDEADAIGASTAPTILPQDNAADLFAFELELQRMRREIGGLQGAVETQRQEIENLRTELERATFRPKPAAVESGVSPEYDEALALARRGLMSSEIAARCGISRAEAELVASLAAQGRESGRKLS
jgi:HAMP domain-containing protein